MQATINGMNMAWDDSGGPGPVVCLIHGFPLNSNMWRPQSEALAAAGFRVIIPDLRGFGESEGTDLDPSMELFADDMASLLDHLGVETAVIGGMSMGGYVLLNIIDRHPQRVSAACFIVTRSGEDDEAGKERRIQLAREVMNFGSHVAADIFARVLFAERTEIERPELVEEARGWMVANDPRGLAGGLLAMARRKDFTPLLSGFSLPCLVIGAKNDRAIPVEQSQMLASGLPDHRLCIIPNAGHMVNLEQPEAFNASLIDFLNSLSTD